MTKVLRLMWVALGLSYVGGAYAALDATDQRFVDRLVKGGPETIRDVAQTLYQSGNTNPEVLDVAAEVLLTRYPQSTERGEADSLAWLCRALGGSANNRYKAALDEVAKKAENRKLRGHCEKASKGLPKGATNSYAAGAVDLEKIRNPPPVAAAPAAKAATAKGKTGAAAPAAQATAAPAVRTVDLSLVREGMSSQEVNEILGPPTNSTQHMTGKQFKPFNFAAKDTQRMYYLYKGVGRIEFSLKSAYEGVYRVIAIKPDPNESGYP